MKLLGLFVLVTYESIDSLPLWDLVGIWLRSPVTWAAPFVTKTGFPPAQQSSGSAASSCPLSDQAPCSASPTCLEAQWLCWHRHQDQWIHWTASVEWIKENNCLINLNTIMLRYTYTNFTHSLFKQKGCKRSIIIKVTYNISCFFVLFLSLPPWQYSQILHLSSMTGA